MTNDTVKYIASRENKLYKLAKALEQTAQRRKKGLYKLEGPNLIEEAILSGADIHSLIVCAGCEEKYSEHLKMDNAAVMDPGLFKDISDTVTSSGIAAIAVRKECSEEEFIEHAGPGACILVMDRLQDPGNIGTLIRTADAAGYSGIITIKGTGDIFSPKTVRAAAGSIFRVPVIQMEDAGAAISFLKKAGKKIACTDVNAGAPYYDAGLDADAAVIIGNEGNGVSEEFLSRCDIRINIPMEGSTESLNAAVAAGILMYERIRCRA